MFAIRDAVTEFTSGQPCWSVAFQDEDRPVHQLMARRVGFVKIVKERLDLRHETRRMACEYCVRCG